MSKMLKTVAAVAVNGNASVEPRSAKVFSGKWGSSLAKGCKFKFIAT